MSTVTLTADLRPLDLLNKELGLYARLAGMSAEDALEKKGRDLGIQLYRGYAGHRFGGSTPRGVAVAELAMRTAQRRGTAVRPELRARYNSARATLTKDVRSAGQYRRQAKRLGVGGLGVYREAAKAGIAARKLRARLWNSIVGAEVALRQSSVNALAVSFLAFRSRSSQARGTWYQRNRSGKTAGFIERGAGSYRIVGLNPFLGVVDSRYGIVAEAIGAVRADMAPYIRRKLVEGMSAFKHLAAA